MDDYRRARKAFIAVIRSAMAIDATAETLDALVGLALLDLNAGRSDEAAGLLAFALHHPDTPDEARNQAFDLFLDLETRICPRVILDASARAREANLVQMVGEVLADDG